MNFREAQSVCKFLLFVFVAFFSGLPNYDPVGLKYYKMSRRIKYDSLPKSRI